MNKSTQPDIIVIDVVVLMTALYKLGVSRIEILETYHNMSKHLSDRDYQMFLGDILDRMNQFDDRN